MFDELVETGYGMFAGTGSEHGISNNTIFRLQFLHQIFIELVKDFAFGEFLPLSQLTNGDALRPRFVDAYVLDVVVPGILANCEPAILNNAGDVDKLVLILFFVALLLVILAVKNLMAEAAVEGEQWATTHF